MMVAKMVQEYKWNNEIDNMLMLMCPCGDGHKGRILDGTQQIHNTQYVLEQFINFI